MNDRVNHAGADPLPEQLRFQRFGRTCHARIDTAEDLGMVRHLDEALWVATTAPLRTFNADEVFLRQLDANQDGRIRAADLKQAITWLLEHHGTPAEVRPGNTELRLAAIVKESSEGERMLGAARKILARGRTADREAISLGEVRLTRKLVEKGGMDSPGMVLPGAAADPESRKLLEAILKTAGGESHPSGAFGVTRQRLDQFRDEAEAYLDWLRRPEANEQAGSAMLPLARETPQGYRLLTELRPKLDQYFALCDLIRLEPSLAGKIRPAEKELEALDISGASAVKEFLEKAPLATPRADGKLRFGERINPAYAKALDEFQRLLVQRLLSASANEIGADQWERLQELFVPHEEWQRTRPEVKVDGLDRQELERLIQGRQSFEKVEALIQESYRTALDLDNIRLLEKLILFQAHLLPLANSFISFPDLYDPESRALFEMGTLVMDGRHFTLAVRVLNRAQHVQFSEASNMFVLYAEVSNKEEEPLYEVAVPVTSGNRGNLQVNKWGVFHDVHGRELYAKVVQIVENPISLAEAISAPFRRLGQNITKRFGEKAAEAESRFQTSGTQAMTTLPPAGQAPPPPGARTEMRLPGGMLAGGGIAVAALGGSLAYIIRTIMEMNILQVLGGLAALALAVLMPVTLVACIKLARRDLSAILEGSGWGLNFRMRLTMPQALTFTYAPSYPAGGAGKRRRRWGWWLLAGVLLALALGGFLFSYLRPAMPPVPSPTDAPVLVPEESD